MAKSDKSSLELSVGREWDLSGVSLPGRDSWELWTWAT